MRIGLIALAALAAVSSATAASSPTPPRIAFTAVEAAAGANLVSVSADGSDLVNLSPGIDTADRDPSWSPDGRQLVFDSLIGSGPTLLSQLYLENADGSDRRQLTNGPLPASGPLWSPGGDLIAFLLATSNTDSEIWAVRPDGTGLRRLTTDGGQKHELAWSPDGTRLLYTRDQMSATAVSVVRLDGAPPQVLAVSGLGTSLAWSPDGSKIALTAPSESWSNALAVMNADGSGEHTIVDMPASHPVWSPDGSLIAFAGSRTLGGYPGGRYGAPQREDVFVVRPDGTGLHRLTGPLENDRLAGAGGSSPTWWPDGSRLFFESNRYPDPASTFEMNSDGTCEQRFDALGPDLLFPVWQPVSGPLPPSARCAELRVYVDVGKSPVGLREPAPWTMTVENDGNITATDVVADLSASAGSFSVEMTGTGDCGIPGGIVDCTGGSLAPGQSEQISGTVSRASAGSIVLHAAVLADQLDTDLTNNSDSAELRVLPCTIVGTDGADVLHGTPGPDRICGLPGADTIYGGAGDDYIDAGNGDDRIYPGPGRDTVLARGGNDVIYARDGQRDWIDCGAQHDVAIVDRVDVVRHCEVVIRPPR